MNRATVLWFRQRRDPDKNLSNPLWPQRTNPATPTTRDHLKASRGHGVIRQGYQGVLRRAAETSPHPFEIVFETPQAAPHYAQVQATVVALTTILGEYRKFISYAANL